MDKFDRMISETLDDEDREILDRIGWEQSPTEMAGDLFRGKFGLLNWSLLLGQVIFFGIGLYAAWKCYQVTEVVDVVRWGLIATFFLLVAVIAKVGLLPSIQANRMMRTLKRLEMQVALLAAKR
ncbi:DUF6768 family protein [Pelagibius sp.]|uniref:DUF6768 family protein n=1 Tax=Pelagibius sp. TaxID=1931238 RepID=UPI003B506CA0